MRGRQTDRQTVITRLSIYKLPTSSAGSRAQREVDKRVEKQEVERANRGTEINQADIYVRHDKQASGQASSNQASRQAGRRVGR